MKLTKLREVRQRKALAQYELARLAGCSPMTIVRIEAGRHAPHPSTARKIATALGCEPSDLMEPAVRARKAVTA